MCTFRGFTLIELLLVVAILAGVMAAAAPLYTTLQTSTQLNEASSELASTVRTARAQAVARMGDASHGVYVTSNSYTLYRGSSYAVRETSYDRVVELDSALTASTTLSGDEVNFSKGFGVPSTTGTIVLTHDVQGTQTITINDLGGVQQ